MLSATTVATPMAKRLRREGAFAFRRVGGAFGATERGANAPQVARMEIKTRDGRIMVVNKSGCNKNALMNRRHHAITSSRHIAQHGR